jgi:hypothetical protein
MSASAIRAAPDREQIDSQRKDLFAVQAKGFAESSIGGEYVSQVIDRHAGNPTEDRDQQCCPHLYIIAVSARKTANPERVYEIAMGITPSNVRYNGAKHPLPVPKTTPAGDVKKWKNLLSMAGYHWSAK